MSRRAGKRGLVAEEPENPPSKPYYFFLSYSRSHPDDDAGQSEDEDEDRYVVDFYKDLCQHIRQLAYIERGVSPGYFDRAMQTSTVWPDAVKRALASSHTFVALYKPGYFQSKWCGREWAAFEARQKRTRPQGSVAHQAIIPVLWVEEKRLPNPLPEAARSIQYMDLHAPTSYRREGVYGLRVSEYDSDYKKTTLAIARLIVDVAETMKIPPCSTSVFRKNVSAFHKGPI